mmetsp:Transcript_23112/g.33858  ORF Transcript_23112/g.33858 Transcript_23112/m.33858 type:complete len:330 (-) Transcript_23112:30-1019(-)
METPSIKTNEGSCVVYNTCSKSPSNVSGVISEEEHLADLFFTLANSPYVGYELNDSLVRVRQNINANNTTGGIVWESAYLLVDYIAQLPRVEGRSVIDLGGGVGFLGLVLSKLKYSVTITEFDERSRCSSPASGVYELLEKNVLEFNSGLNNLKEAVRVCRLDWTRSRQDITEWVNAGIFSQNELQSGFELVVGTDVLFSPALVRPLLSTASQLTREVSGECMFCMQIRCEDSHKLFLEAAHEYFDCVRDISEEVYTTPGCEWGKAMECLVFRMTGGKMKLVLQSEENHTLKPNTNNKRSRLSSCTAAASDSSSGMKTKLRKHKKHKIS